MNNTGTIYNQKTMKDMNDAIDRYIAEEGTESVQESDENEEIDVINEQSTKKEIMPEVKELPSYSLSINGEVDCIPEDVKEMISKNLQSRLSKKSLEVDNQACA